MILELYVAQIRRNEKHQAKDDVGVDADEADDVQQQPSADGGDGDDSSNTSASSSSASVLAMSKPSEKVIVSSIEGGPLALILAPTRELVMQVSQSIQAIAQFSPVVVVPIVGGISFDKQERLLRKKPQIIVATPGRLWEHFCQVRGTWW
jgi:hypothetical protein